MNCTLSETPFSFLRAGIRFSRRPVPAHVSGQNSSFALRCHARREGVQSQRLDGGRAM
jgi:hypothetical protein